MRRRHGHAGHRHDDRIRGGLCDIDIATPRVREALAGTGTA